MGRESHFKELVWVSRNLTKLYVGSDEAAWGFLCKNVAIHATLLIGNMGLCNRTEWCMTSNSWS